MMCELVPVLAAAVVLGAAALEHPIVAGRGGPVYLDGSDWALSHFKSYAQLGRSPHHAEQPGPARLPATVPGDVLTDLQRAGVTGDPYFNHTWRTAEFVEAWNTGYFVYTKQFAPPPASSVLHLLVLEGVRMGAMVHLNGNFIGNTSDQFIRYTYPLQPSDLVANNTLSITFGSGLLLPTGGRFTFAGQIDWAPVMPTRDPTTSGARFGTGERSTFGFAVWKSVYLLPVPQSTAAISHFVPHTFYGRAREHPTELLADGAHGGFVIRAMVQLWLPPASGAGFGQGQVGVVAVQGNWPGAARTAVEVTLHPGYNNVTITVPASDTASVKLWHPRGHGAQILYFVNATYTPASAAAAATTATRRIGFRHIALVTVNDTDPGVAKRAAKEDGTGGLTMFFRVNGAAMYARGGNKVPMDLMEGRYSADATRRLVQSAAEANFNMLRVWGGGVYEPRAFYDACDEFGILLYHDLMFTWGSIDASINATGTNSTATVAAELDYQLKRLSHHPSIGLWSACNECGGGGGSYDRIVMPFVAAIDRSRPIWPSSPSAGWSGGVDRLSCRPNGRPLVHATDWGLQPDPPSRPPGYPFTLESHGPYSGMLNPFALSPLTPYINSSMLPQSGRTPPESCNMIKCPKTGCVNTKVCNWYAAPGEQTGPGSVGWFRSEFGANAWSSFESMSAQLPSDQWSMSSNASSYRNWNVSNLIATYFGESAVSVGMRRSGAREFKRQLYQSMLAQVLFMKVAIEAWRSTNVWGTLFWMYNEVWATGGWGSIEYGSPVPGQIPGGRWKPLQYALMNSMFADRMAACNSGGSCFVTNSVPFAFEGTVAIRLVNVLTGTSATMAAKPVSLPSGAGTVHWFCAGSPPAGLASALPIRCAGWRQAPEWSSVGCTPNGNNCVAVIKVWGRAAGTGTFGSAAVSTSFVPFQPPKIMQLPNAAITAHVGGPPNTAGIGAVPITLTTNATALYVVLTTKARGRFSNNALLLEPGLATIVDFLPWAEPFDLQLLTSSLRIEHLAENM